MALSGRTGWGFLSSQIAVTSAANAVLNNVGAALQVLAGNGSIRLTKLLWRVDLAPDVAPGSAVVPVRWRVVVFSGTIPPDITALQLQAFPAPAAHPEIPAKVGIGAPVSILYDNWLDFSAGDPGLNKLAGEDFPDGGPTVNALETMNVAIFPMQDTLAGAPAGAANAIITLGAWGTGVTVNPQGGNGSVDGGSRSLPRYDVSV